MFRAIHSRREFLYYAASVAVVGSVPATTAASNPDDKLFLLRAVGSQQQIVPEKFGRTGVWTFNHRVPGPEIRVNQGDFVKVLLQNELEESTTVHWHGLRVSNSMDGIPHLTQPPIEQGDSFLYEFEAKDAGTFWYHPHQRSFEQVGRGLHGPLIVEENESISVDRDITWTLDDWKLLPSAQIADDFADMHDVSHAGRIGNTVTINGSIPETFPLQSGERIRLRLINAANARIFGLEFEAHDPKIIAIDGHPIIPHSPENNQIVLAPGMRTDVVIDCTGEPKQQFAVTDNFYDRQTYRLVDLVYETTVKRSQLMNGPIQLPPNPVSRPDLANAIRFDVHLGGGAGGSMEGGIMNGQWHDIRSMVHNNKAWAINDIVSTGHVMDPLIKLRRGAACVLNMQNDTAWHHPMHLHGHTFQVVSRNGLPTRYQEWQDTVSMSPEERVEIAFVADNPGDWMFHCHILEHQAGGMMGVIRVA